MMSSRGWYYLGKALSLFDEDWDRSIDVVKCGYRIRIERLDDHKHRKMIEGDL
jgi:hypothetical protein